MATEHTCTFEFEKNVTHIHISSEAPPAPQATSRRAGKYTCSCGNFELRDPVQAVEQQQPEQPEGAES